MIPEKCRRGEYLTYIVPDWLEEHHKELVIGEKRFGIYLGELPDEKGQISFEDAILPISAVIPNDKNVDLVVNMEVDSYKDCPFFQYVQNDYKEARKFDRENYDKFIPGRLIHVGVGDGYATYIITKVNKKTVDVEWRGWSNDRWVDRFFGRGGRFRREDVERFVSLIKSPFHF